MINFFDPLYDLDHFLRHFTHHFPCRMSRLIANQSRNHLQWKFLSFSFTWSSKKFLVVCLVTRLHPCLLRLCHCQYLSSSLRIFRTIYSFTEWTFVWPPCFKLALWRDQTKYFLEVARPRKILNCPLGSGGLDVYNYIGLASFAWKALVALFSHPALGKNQAHHPIQG